jgi:hypothetical protein
MLAVSARLAGYDTALLAQSHQMTMSMGAIKNILRGAHGMYLAAANFIEQAAITTRILSSRKLCATYYPQQPSKSRVRIWADHIVWLLRYRNAHHYYFAYGLDKRGVSCFRALPERMVMSYATSKNQPVGSRPAWERRVLSDKVFFSEYGESRGHPVPLNAAIFKDGVVSWNHSRVTAHWTRSLK